MERKALILIPVFARAVCLYVVWIALSGCAGVINVSTATQAETSPDSLNLVQLEQAGLEGSLREYDTGNMVSSLEIEDFCLENECPSPLQSTFRFGIGAPANTKSKLGSSIRSWLAYDLRFLKNWRFSLSGKKDSGEPFFTKVHEPWLFTESKRVSLSYSNDRITWVVGDFRATHGSGFVSGSGWSEFSTPLTLSTVRGNRLRLGANTGNHAKPSRRGISLQIEPFRGLRTQLFAFRSKLTGSFDGSVDSLSPVIEGISGTYVFESAASLERRNSLKVHGVGIATSVETKSFSGGLFFESIGYSSSFSTSLKPMWIGEVSSRIQFGRITGKVELSGSSQGLSRLLAEMAVSHRSKGTLKLSWNLDRNTFMAPFGTAKIRDYATSTLVAAVKTPQIEGNQMTLSLVATTKQPKMEAIDQSTQQKSQHQLESVWGVLTFKRKPTAHIEWSSMASHRLSINTHPMEVLSPRPVPTDESKSQLTQSVKYAVSESVSIRSQWSHSRDSSYHMVRNMLGVSAAVNWKQFEAQIAWVTASNSANSTGSGTSYFAAPNVKGFFPVSQITGNGASMTAMIGYHRHPFSIEFHVVESQTRTFENIASERSGFSYQLQLTVSN